MSTCVSVMRPGNTMRFFESISSGLVLLGMLGAMFSFILCVRVRHVLVQRNEWTVYTLPASPMI